MLPWSLAILILVVDQWTKAWIRFHFSYGESRAIIDGFFNWSTCAMMGGLEFIKWTKLVINHDLVGRPSFSGH